VLRRLKVADVEEGMLGGSTQVLLLGRAHCYREYVSPKKDDMIYLLLCIFGVDK
jgi:hypothetical protein